MNLQQLHKLGQKPFKPVLLLGIIGWSFRCTETVATVKLNNLALPSSAASHFTTLHSRPITRHKPINIDFIVSPSTLGANFFTWTLTPL